MSTVTDGSDLAEPLIQDGSVLVMNEKRVKYQGNNSRRYLWAIIVLLVIVNLSTFIVGITLWALRPSPSCSAKQTVTYFGELPYKDTLWEEDKRFVDTNPKVFYNETGADDYSAWSSIYPSGWVAVQNHPDSPLVGGAPLSYWGSEEEEWAPDTQAWATTLMHQLHCLGTMKSAYHYLEEGKSLNKERHGHIPHCIEYLRQAIMCQADLTLEPPMDPMHWPQGTSGWGVMHKCRDWDAVLAIVSKNSVLREQGKWVHWKPEQK